MVSLFGGNWESPLISGTQPPRLPYAAVPIRRRSAFRTTTVKLIGISSELRSASLRNRDLYQFVTLIAIPWNPQGFSRDAINSGISCPCKQLKREVYAPSHGFEPRT